jgi:hypothetical protein
MECKGKDVSLSCPNNNLDFSWHTLIFTEEPLTSSYSRINVTSELEKMLTHRGLEAAIH